MYLAVYLNLGYKFIPGLAKVDPSNARSAFAAYRLIFEVLPLCCKP